MDQPRLVSVALPLPLSDAYTYEVPVEMELELGALIGSRVLVPFGSRTLTGVVVGEASERPRRVKPIREVLDAEPALSLELIELTRWIANYYYCGWGEAIRAALPPGTEISSRLSAHRVPQPAGAVLPDRFLSLLDAFGGLSGVSLSALERVGHSRASVQAAERQGLLRIAASLSSKSISEKTQLAVRLLERAGPVDAAGRAAGAHDGSAEAAGNRGGADGAATGAVARPAPLGAAQQRVLDALRAHGEEAPLAREILRAARAGHSTLHSLAGRGLVSVEQRVVRRDRFAPEQGGSPRPERFHPSQDAAVGAIARALTVGGFRTFLLHGITGSGKTEVYLAALEQVLAMGKSGIVLVPEIALTPQTVSRFRSRFGEQVGVLHSRMAAGERFDTWHAIRRGEYRVVVGPRSAVLAPVRDLGLIVVDEEHESSYKQFEPAPRYHARDVAVMRCSMSGAVCILGSATPSLESLHNARTERYSLLEMADRAPTAHDLPATLPSVRIIDRTTERGAGTDRTALSTPLRREIQKRLARSEQVILLQNRRGYAPVLECASCGWTPECADCSVSMTHHKSHGQIRCHYCGRAHKVPAACPTCDATHFLPLGLGTQRVEEELTAAFPEARILRMDFDTTGGKNAHHRILDRFGKGEADILLGTQMVAKGLDFGRVTLVGVIDADAGLLFPDFRAEERSFQLLTQVAGRAGRADLPGEVLLQTRHPRHPVLRFAKSHDYQRFADAALPEREQFAYPPFGRLVRVEFRADDEQTASRLASDWIRVMERIGLPATIAGPAPAFVARVKKSWRFQAVLKIARTLSAARLRSALSRAEKALAPLPTRARIVVDIDPMGML